ncbi:MAG: hypothetical protein KDI79_02880 [Anaerolineae bacterium]|nr:hypothetical protein [Anaerolineae bacterium]
MYKLREMNYHLLRSVAAFLLVVMFGVVSASAKSPVVNSTHSALENEMGAATTIGTQAVNTSRITPFAARAARIAQSDQYLAVVYQYGSAIRLRSTKKENEGAWIPLHPTLGSGAAPSLVFSDNTTVHAVWVTTNQRQIMYASCTVAVKSASCGTAAAINSNDGNTVEAPEITFLPNNTLYVAWIKSSANQVITAHKATNSSSWQLASPLSASSSSAGTLALAASVDTVHLAYSYNGGNNIKYYRSTNGGDTWINPKDFGPDVNYQKVSNPTIEANGNNVYLAWDSLRSGTPDPADNLRKYALMGVLSTNKGLSWVDSNGNPSSNPVPRYITSKNPFGSGTSNDQRRTRNTDGANPAEEAGLRPSLALNELNRFAIVWQQRPDATCAEDEGGSIITNGTSEIYYSADANPSTPNSSGWWATGENPVETPSVNFYSIDPDLVIDSSGNEHTIFMKSSADSSGSNCRAGGGASDYAIYYRGPYFTTIEPEQVILPFILK